MIRRMNATGNRATRRRLPPAKRREEIVEAATDLISAAGFNATTIDDFAQAAQLSRPGLLHHFSSREALLEAVLIRRDGETVAAVRTGESVLSPAAAQQAITDLLKYNSERRELVRLYTVLSAEALSPGHPAHEYFARRQESVRELFEEKVFSWHSDPKSASQLLMAFLDGVQAAWLRDSGIDMAAQWRLFAPALMRPSE